MTKKAEVRLPKDSSKRVVYIGLIANVAIAIAKYIAAFATGSSSMLAEAFHSTADFGNEILLLIGIRRSAQPPDELHPYGYGKVLYFYAMLVAVYIFGVGGGLAVHEGVSQLRHPTLSEHPTLNYLVLLVTLCFEGYSWRVSYRELLSRKDADESVWDQIRGSKDPSVFIIFFEDSAGIIGAVIAFLGIFLGHTFRNPYFDPIGSILIGALLANIALIMGREIGALLVGERTNRSKLKKVKDVISADEAVEQVGNILTMQLGPNQVLLTVEIQFRRGLSVEQLEAVIDRLETKIRQQEPSIQRIFIEAESFKRKDESGGRARAA